MDQDKKLDRSGTRTSIGRVRDQDIYSAATGHAPEPVKDKGIAIFGIIKLNFYPSTLFLAGK